MKKIKHLFSNTLTLILLLVLGVVLALFLSSRSENDQPVAQATQAKVTIAPTTEVKATPLPTTTATATLAPAIQPAEPPKDDTPEPTWTPVIIFPVGTPPPLPSPPSTPTATPINPNESEIAAFDVPVGGVAISPDDQILAVVPLVELPDKTLVNQIWTVDLSSKKIEKLNTQGMSPTWSPDGQRILFRVQQNDQFVIKVIDKDGKNEKHLTSFERKGLLDYFWLTANEVGVIGVDGVYRMDLAGKLTGKVNLNLPTKIKDLSVKQADRGQNEVIVVNEGNNLLIVDKKGQISKITDSLGRSIDKFSLSKDGKQLAYVVNEGPSDELWINDISSSSPQKLYRIDMGHIRDLTWMPDNKTILIGWGETGTNVPTVLLWLDSKTGKQEPVGVHGVDQDFVTSHKGDRLFYSRSFDDNADGVYQTTLYQLEIKQ